MLRSSNQTHPHKILAYNDACYYCRNQIRVVWLSAIYYLDLDVGEPRLDLMCQRLRVCSLGILAVVDRNDLMPFHAHARQRLARHLRLILAD